MLSDKGTRTIHHVPTNPILQYPPLIFPPLSIPTTHSSMNPSFINGSHKADPNSFWKWKGINTPKKKRSRQNSVTKFLQESSKKIEAAALGPGGGAGIGCGVGIGFGLVGGVGYGGGPWSHLRMAFGIGMGCGAGVGIGFGRGIGVGLSMDSLQSYLSEEKSDSNKRVLIPI